MDKGERFNTITHAAGVVLAVGGTAILVVMAAFQGDPWKIVSVCIYGETLIILYLFSALYHGGRRAKAPFFKRSTIAPSIC